MKCECSSIKNSELSICGKKPRFYIVDLACGRFDGVYTKFWVCDECIRHFIDKNEDNPHYIILKTMRYK